VADTEGISSELRATTGQRPGRPTSSCPQMAHADSIGWDGWPGIVRPSGRGQPAYSGSTMAHAAGTERGTAQSHGMASPRRSASEPRERDSRRRPNSDWWAAEPDVGRVAHGIPAELDFIRRLIGEGDYSQADAETRHAVWQVVRAVWEHREIAAPSPHLYRDRLRDLVPGLSCERARQGWLLGSRLEEDKTLRDLWRRVHAEPFEAAQHLLPELLKRVGQKKRPEALGTRVDRLRALGNAVVPQVAYHLGQQLLALDRTA
jgi:hypothetical protein